MSVFSADKAMETNLSSTRFSPQQAIEFYSDVMINMSDENKIQILSHSTMSPWQIGKEIGRTRNFVRKTQKEFLKMGLIPLK